MNDENENDRTHDLPHFTPPTPVHSTFRTEHSRFWLHMFHDYCIAAH